MANKGYITMTKTILIVEDNPDALDLLGMYFEAKGYDVDLARDGLEGWEAVLQYRPSVILSDYLMPNMDGVKLCEKLKREQRYADIPFILMTGTPHLPSCTCQTTMVMKPLDLERLTQYIEALPA